MTVGESKAWLKDARVKLGTATLGAHAEEVGRVEEVGDGVALVSGLRHVQLDELLRFERGQLGFAQMLDQDRVGCVLIDDVDGVEAGDSVRGTGDVVHGAGAARPGGRSTWPSARRQGSDRRRDS
jgi:F-type H+-transporting ATPase subunit alpha